MIIRVTTRLQVPSVGKILSMLSATGVSVVWCLGMFCFRCIYGVNLETAVVSAGMRMGVAGIFVALSTPPDDNL